MAVSALEMACWDLYGKVTEKPLWKLLGEEFDRMTRVATAFEGEDVAGGFGRAPATGMGRRARCTAARWWAWARPPKRWLRCASAWSAGIPAHQAESGRRAGGLPAVRAVRRAVPRICICQPWTRTRASPAQPGELRSYDELDIGWSESH